MQTLLNAPLTGQKTTLDTISLLDANLYDRFASKFSIDTALTRSLVSFQDSKSRSRYRWYKFKEAFSPSLIEYLLSLIEVPAGRLLDPFAGSGTALFAAKEFGWNTAGIELLPIGQTLIESRARLEDGYLPEEIKILRQWAEDDRWQTATTPHALPELRITKGAYPAETHSAIAQYIEAIKQEPQRIQGVLWLALLSILESVSYTRKDGQYLRWDYRSGRKQGKKRFDKGYIPPFKSAIRAKLNEILEDLQPSITQLSLFQDEKIQVGTVHLWHGSCLEVLPSLPNGEFNLVMTSPPYCNRYDYTRTYALELALLGVDEKGLSGLRQTMLSCTVENRVKDLLALNSAWVEAIKAADEQPLLQAILHYLDEQKKENLLNNTGIPRMVRGYFYEMACVIQECARVLKRGGQLLMVNDNVRYAGASISVDMILSAMAESLGFQVKQILVLPNGKGNSSQQMGEHGREELRKCVYVWQKL